LDDARQHVNVWRYADTQGCDGIGEISGAQQAAGSGVARYRKYPTADGRHVALGALEEKFWRCFCEAAGRPEWFTRISEPIPQTRLTADLAAYFAELTLEACTQCFAAPDCCVTPILTVGEAMELDYCRQRELVRRCATGDLQALFPARVDGEPPALRPAVKEEWR
jgi:alpha-methylacyl-CoA racemase